MLGITGPQARVAAGPYDVIREVADAALIADAVDFRYVRLLVMERDLGVRQRPAIRVGRAGFGQYGLRVRDMARLTGRRVQHHVLQLGLRDDVVLLHVVTDRITVGDPVAVLPVLAQLRLAGCIRLRRRSRVGRWRRTAGW